jgi:hypothetical protein
MKVKAGKDIVDVIRLAYTAGKPVLLEGRHGIGKSNLIEQAAKELGISCIVRDLSLMEPPDLTGLPIQDNGRTRYAPPSFLPEGGKGLLVFEELNRADRYMMAPCLTLLTSKTLNDYTLPEGWLCIAAINPASEGYDTAELDPALLSRFLRVEIVSDAQSWLEWAKNEGIHHSVLRFVSQTPDIFASDSSNTRSWSYVSDMLKAYEAQGVENENLLVTAIAGLIGEPLAVAFIQSSMREENAIPAEMILTEYEKHRPMIQHWVQTKKMDLLVSTANGVQIALQNVDTAMKIAKTEVLVQNLETFLSDLPADIAKKLRKACKQVGALK